MATAQGVVAEAARRPPASTEQMFAFSGRRGATARRGAESAAEPAAAGAQDGPRPAVRLPRAAPRPRADTIDSAVTALAPPTPRLRPPSAPAAGRAATAHAHAGAHPTCSAAAGGRDGSAGARHGRSGAGGGGEGGLGGDGQAHGGTSSDVVSSHAPALPGLPGAPSEWGASTAKMLSLQLPLEVCKKGGVCVRACARACA